MTFLKQLINNSLYCSVIIRYVHQYHLVIPKMTGALQVPLVFLLIHLCIKDLKRKIGTNC